MAGLAMLSCNWVGNLQDAYEQSEKDIRYQISMGSLVGTPDNGVVWEMESCISWKASGYARWKSRHHGWVSL